jgi:hypothetical protein
MTKAQLIGGLIDAGIWIAAGIFIQFFLPKNIQKRIEQ